MNKPRYGKPKTANVLSLSRKLPLVGAQKSAPSTIASPPKPKVAKPPSIRKK